MDFSAKEAMDQAIRLAKTFGYAEDAFPHGISIDYELRPEADSYQKQLLTEYRQSLEEGKDIQRYEALFRAVAALPASAERERLADFLFRLVMAAPVVAGYPYVEPSHLEDIRKERPKVALSLLKKEPDRATLRDRVHGAWIGRICGCLLGKPVEGIRTPELKRLLEATGNKPLHRYLSKADIPESLYSEISFPLKNRCWADTIDCAPWDDDTNYTVLSLLLVTWAGRDFTPENVLQVWIDKQSRRSYFTAERVAYNNYSQGFLPPDTAVYKNPFREWIGAQIRSDFYGYVNPGDPEKAAEMAWRDASISHIKNGIYGAMFVAAMLAAAAVESDLETIVLAGIAQIPAHSRLAERLWEVLDDYRSKKSAEACFRRIHALYDERNGHDWCHTLSNAMIVAAALLYGGGAYGKSICMAVEAGFDTDCNGATVGSVLGMRGGASCIEPAWTAPIHNKLQTTIQEIGMVSIDELVERTLRFL